MSSLARWFVHPGFLWLAPLLALPVIIHLLNRIRYKRVRWAAIEFLLTTERRAVRRARLRQILLMALRVFLLTAALAALAQPVFRGGIARLLGGSANVAVLLDTSASMSASHASGAAFDRAKQLAVNVLGGLSQATRATAAHVSVHTEFAFAEPVSDLKAVAAVVKSGELVSGTADVPLAFRSAAASLRRIGGGGVIWLLTDGRAEGWRATDSGAWSDVRRALAEAGKPRVVISNVAPAVRSNLSVVSVKVVPRLLVEGDTPTLTATVALHGEAAAASVSLFLDGKPVGTRTLRFSEAGKMDCVFRLPPIGGGRHVARLDLGRDEVPGDNRYSLLLSTAERVPVLIVDGAPSATPFAGAGDFLAVAVRPPSSVLGARSIFIPETVRAAALAGRALEKYAAIFLADVGKLEPPVAEGLKAYLDAGGLVLIFPGARTDRAAWNELAFTGVTFESVVEAGGDKPMAIGWTAPSHPLTATLGSEGVAAVKITRMFKLRAASKDGVLAVTDGGHPFLVQTQVGKGKVLVFAVSGQLDSSNLPLRVPFLLILHRALRMHLVESADPPAHAAFAEVRLSVPPGECRIATPGGRMLPVTRLENAPGRALFEQTGQAGVYRLVRVGRGEADLGAGTPVAAVNVPAAESSLDVIRAETVRSLLGEVRVDFADTERDAAFLGGSREGPSAASSFPLAVIAVLLLLGEVLLAWSMSRPRRTTDNET